MKPREEGGSLGLGVVSSNKVGETLYSSPSRLWFLAHEVNDFALQVLSLNATPEV